MRSRRFCLNWRTGVPGGDESAKDSDMGMMSSAQPHAPTGLLPQCDSSNARASVEDSWPLGSVQREAIEQVADALADLRVWFLDDGIF